MKSNSIKLFGILNIRYLVLFAILLIFSSSCGIVRKSDARKVSPNVEDRVRKAVEEGRGIQFGKIGKGGGGSFEFASSNALWRATLEVLDFIPLSNVDYSGGIIITDWYNEGTSNDESIKITVRFLANEIRADGVSVIVHRKICNKSLECTIGKIESALIEEIKVAILKKATLIVKGEKQKRRKENQKKYGKNRKVM